MRITIFALPLFILLTSTPAAAEWTSFSKGEDRTEYFIDFSTYKRTPKPRAWLLINKELRDKFGDMSAMVLYEADCSEDKIRGISWQFYNGTMGTGNLTTTDNVPGEWNYASPGSVNTTILKTLCGRR
jgi:hypothetical protein